jgi:hypothetical protein
MIKYYNFHKNLDAMHELYSELDNRFPLESYRTNKDITDLTLSFLKKSLFLRLSVTQSDYELKSISPKLYREFDECLEMLVDLEKKYLTSNILI